MTQHAQQPHSSSSGHDQELPDYGQPAYELPGYGEQTHSRKRGVHWGWVIGTLTVLLVILVVVAEILARIVVGQVAASQIEDAMPEAVRADVEASPTGWCVLCEVIGGELSGLDVEGKNVEFGGARGTIDLRAEGITLTDPVALDGAEGTVEIGEASLNKLLASTAEEYGFTVHGLDLKDGVFGYTTEVQVFGIEVQIRVDASARMQSGGRIQINAESLSIQTGAAPTDIQLNPENFTLEFCVAEHLPEMLEITSVEVVDDALVIGYRSTEPFTLTEDAFQTRGSCS
ncbi:LmeA family phospholipid-binding protein [Gulosibacter chungangensis]|uniref:LmeA family phospholipid-binding protein n=1 Tax=Gulosibacter chungangensis TaxID=979746 RepID=UPI001787F2DC|nr:DUF2993 domain-containing protein [Gulosibacter chungangensis]